MFHHPFFFTDTLLRNDTSDYDLEVQISSEIFEKILQCLSDRCRQVQVASAITLFALNRGTQKVSVNAWFVVFV